MPDDDYIASLEQRVIRAETELAEARQAIKAMTYYAATAWALGSTEDPRREDMLLRDLRSVCRASGAPDWMPTTEV